MKRRPRNCLKDAAAKVICLYLFNEVVNPVKGYKDIVEDKRKSFPEYVDQA